MKFGYVILYVPNVSAAVSFYEQAFGLTRRFMHESLQYAEMETGDTILAYASHELANSNLPDGFKENSLANRPAGMEICFVAEDVSSAFLRAVEVGAVAVVEPKVKPWGQTIAYVRDPNGTLVEIASPM